MKDDILQSNDDTMQSDGTPLYGGCYPCSLVWRRELSVYYLF